MKTKVSLKNDFSKKQLMKIIAQIDEDRRQSTIKGPTGNIQLKQKSSGKSES